MQTLNYMLCKVNAFS